METKTTAPKIEDSPKLWSYTMDLIFADKDHLGNNVYYINKERYLTKEPSITFVFAYQFTWKEFLETFDQYYPIQVHGKFRED